MKALTDSFIPTANQSTFLSADVESVVPFQRMMAAPSSLGPFIMSLNYRLGGEEAISQSMEGLMVDHPHTAPELTEAHIASKTQCLPPPSLRSNFQE